jgi:LuxR family transcriptional regulator, maltose regulon positive regulatory protein
VGIRLTLVTGPAGFGKTTVLAQAYREVIARGGWAIWLGCHENDADPAHFLDSLCAAAALAGVNQDHALFTPADLAERIAAFRGSVCLMLDDFERIIGSAAEPLVERLITLLPSDTHVILGSRMTPRSWFLARELRGEAATIDPKALRLTGTELQSLLHERFAADDVSRIEQLTEGWPVAVQLTRLRSRDSTALRDLLVALERGGFGLFDYLAERVLESLSLEQREFLRDTSILPFVNPRAINALTLRDDGYALLAGIMHLQPIITVTADSELTIRLHPLFRQFMRDQLARTGQTREAELHRRAARFFSERGRILEALQHALDADDVTLAVEIFDAAGAEMLLFTLGPRKVRQILTLMPERARERSIRWYFTELITGTLDGRAAFCFQLLDSFKKDLPHATPSYVATDDIPTWLKFADALADLWTGLLRDLYAPSPTPLLELATRAASHVRRGLKGSDCYLAMVRAFEALINARHGQLSNAHVALNEYRDLCVRSGTAANMPSIDPQRCMLAFLAGDFDESLRLMPKATARRLDKFDDPEELLLFMTRSLLGVINYERGAFQEALEATDSVPLNPERTLAEILALCIRTKVLCHEALGSPTRADTELQNAFVDARRQNASRLLMYLTALKTEIHSRRGLKTTPQPDLIAFLEQELAYPEPSWIMLDQAARALQDRKSLEQLSTLAEAQGRRHLQATALIMLAACEGQDTETAAMHLRAALEITSQNGATQPYVDLAPNITGLLVRLGAEPAPPQVALHRRLVLRALESRQDTAPTLWESLSDRERDILLALAAQPTTKAVARALGLSPETVKHHLKRIFAKLGVHSRSEALEKLSSLVG